LPNQLALNIKENKGYTMKQQPSRGFTLIELLVVIMILGVIASFAVPKFFGIADQAKKDTAKLNIGHIEAALTRYKAANGFFPSTDQGLKALVKKPTTQPIPNRWAEGGYIKKVPVDPWHRKFQYLNSDEKIYIYSYGPKKDTEEDDISNKDTEENEAEE